MNHAAAAKDVMAKLPGWRAVALFVLLLSGLAGLLGRGVYLQGIHNDFLQEKGNARYSRVIEVSAHRGMITDRNGDPLAVSTPVESVWASPSDVEVDNRQVRKLAKILGMGVEELKNRLFDTSRDFVYLKRQLPPDQAEKVVSLNLPGVSLQREYRRYYPAGEETAQTLGFTGQDDNGQEGLELSMQEQLGGKPGSQRVIKDRRGHIVEDAGSLRAPKPGSDVVLSIDSKMQYLAYRELKNAVEQHRAKAGAVVVLDAQSGEVLALANYPGYNPNNRGKIKSQAMRNRAIADLFEPGSTMKPFTVATAIEMGKVNPNTIIDTENGLFTLGGRKIHDAHLHKSGLSVAEIIQESSNVGSAKIALSLKSEAMWQGLADSGFGEKTGSNFPGEASGKLRDPKTWRPIEQATISYGNGISVNLLQLARAYTIFANDGELKPITLLKVDAPVAGKKVFSARTARMLRDMLEMVVQRGTAPLARVAGYRVAGKTGTAHKLENGQYVNRYIASFVGLAPVSSPRLVVAVMIDEPSGAEYYGGQVAAPVFSKITAAALHALNVPNDAPLDNVIEMPAEIIKEEA